jgi:hypothetical protein
MRRRHEESDENPMTEPGVLYQAYVRIVESLRIRRSSGSWEPNQDREDLAMLEDLYDLLSLKEQERADREGWRSWPDLHGPADLSDRLDTVTISTAEYAALVRVREAALAWAWEPTSVLSAEALRRTVANHEAARVLEEAATFLERHGFVPGACARDHAHRPVPPDSANAARFCISGAARAVAFQGNDGDGTREESIYLQAMDAVCAYVGTATVHEWADVPGRTTEDAVRVMRAAAQTLTRGKGHRS